MSSFIFQNPRFRPVGNYGLTLPNCYLQFFYTNTTTLAPIYANSALTTSLPNPIKADGTGQFPVIYMDSAITYREQLYDQYGNLQYDEDPAAYSQTEDLASGVYSPIFESGYLQWTGPNNTFKASSNFIAGLELPNPTGIPGPALLLGSGGGGGTPVTFCIIQDQAFDDITPGNTLIITAGETQPSGIAPGGLLNLIGGASYGGQGGTIQLQGGTSAYGNGGFAILQGGNATNGGKPGDVFVLGGQVGNSGATVHLIATYLGGTSGVIRFRQNSNIMMDFIPIGTGTSSVPFGMYLYQGGGWGSPGAPLVSGGQNGATTWLTNGFSGSATFGTAHTMQIVNGLITGYS